MELPFSNNLIEITVRYAKRPDGGIEVIRNKKHEKKYKDISVLETTWKSMSIQDFTNLTGQSMMFSDNEEAANMDIIHYRQTLMEHCMTNWNIEGFPCSLENMQRLDANVANYLIDEYVKRTSFSSSIEGDPLFDMFKAMEARVEQLEVILADVLVRLEQRDTGDAV